MMYETLVIDVHVFQVERIAKIPAEIFGAQNKKKAYEVYKAKAQFGDARSQDELGFM